jgi:hypothetical protein
MARSPCESRQAPANENDQVRLEHTLNTLNLKLPDGLAINAVGDGYRVNTSLLVLPYTNSA